MKNMMSKVALLVLGLGTVMLLGTSYSLINNSLVSDETFGFEVANFDVSFNDNNKISISSIPQDDTDGIKNSAEYTFDVKNNGDHDINYRLDIVLNGTDEMKDYISKGFVKMIDLRVKNKTMIQIWNDCYINN